VVGFLGPNGAGKSTTLRILAGFIGATSGEARINGFSVAEQSIEARASIGYMPESSPLYPEMRVREYLYYRAELKRVPRARRHDAIDASLSDAGLTDVARVLIAQLSKGYRQRVGLADALVASPPLLILDEPTAGLDPNQIRDVRALIKRLREKHTILVSTHILSEVEAMCTRGLVIAAGELVAQGSLDELRALRRPVAVQLRVRGAAAAARRVLEQVPGAAAVALDSQPSEAAPRFTVDFSDPADSDATTERIGQALQAAGLSVLEMVPSSSLEQVFADLTMKKQRPADREARP
jgi:ABC-2 type transport system ATP-binding protein